MNGVMAVLDSKASFELAAFFVTWVAIAFVTVTLFHLLMRVRQLELSSARSLDAKPYAGLLERNIAELVGMADAPFATTLLLLSSACPACRRVLDEIRAHPSPAAYTIAWTDGGSSDLSRDVPNANVLDGGALLQRELGVGVTPFAIVTDDTGRITNATPIASLTELDRLAGRAAA